MSLNLLFVSQIVSHRSAVDFGSDDSAKASRAEGIIAAHALALNHPELPKEDSLLTTLANFARFAHKTSLDKAKEEALGVEALPTRYSGSQHANDGPGDDNSTENAT